MRTLLLACALALSATPAFARTCTDDLRQIDKALQSPNLSKKFAPGTIDEARKVRAQGAELCYRGRNDDARAVLREAIRLLDLG